MRQRVSLNLYKKFKWRVTGLLILVGFCSFLGSYLSFISNQIFHLAHDSSGSISYEKCLFPLLFRSHDWKVSKFQFGFFWLLLIFLWAFVFLAIKWVSEWLNISIVYFVLDLVEKKFSNLSFEERLIRGDQMCSLISEDVHHLGDWFEIPCAILSFFLSTFFDILFNWGDIKTLNWTQGVFTFVSGFLVFGFFHLVFKTTKKIEEEKRKRREKEWIMINKEKTFSNLSDSMGFLEKLRAERKVILQKNRASFLRKTSIFLNSLEFIPHIYIQYLFHALFFFLADSKFFCATSSHILMDFFFRIDSLLGSLRELKEHEVSSYRVESFLSLNEWDNQLKGFIVSNPLKLIKLEKVCFSYRNQSNLVIDNRNAFFSSEQVNYLSGKNGTGKSTLIFLLLGVLKPLSGRIILELDNGLSYDLSEINLKHWREKNVAYISHQTLLEEGSTGERQLKNIQNVIKEKSNAWLWILDEADNALDKNNQQFVSDKVEELVSQNRIVIWVKHLKNS